MSKFSVKISDIQKEHKPKYYVSTWDMSSIRAKEKYRLYKNDVHNLRKFERSEQRLRTVELYSNNQNFGYGQKFLIDLVRNGTERLPQFSPVKQRQNNGRHGNYRRNALGRNNSV